VAPGNLPSQAIIAKFGGEYLGQQIDEEDGPEDIYEITAEDFARRDIRRRSVGWGRAQRSVE
jgi:RimJ/RimL family protein N-acetyltransferase